MLVVPDNTTMKKVPSVEGMMVYRKDNNKIYAQGDKKLSALAKEKKVWICGQVSHTVTFRGFETLPFMPWKG